MSEGRASVAGPLGLEDSSVDHTPIFPVPGNAISNEPGVPLSRQHSGNEPGSLQPEKIGRTALRTAGGRTDARKVALRHLLPLGPPAGAQTGCRAGGASAGPAPLASPSSWKSCQALRLRAERRALSYPILSSFNSRAAFSR